MSNCLNSTWLCILLMILGIIGSAHDMKYSNIPRNSQRNHKNSVILVSDRSKLEQVAGR